MLPCGIRTTYLKCENLYIPIFYTLLYYIIFFLVILYSHGIILYTHRIRFCGSLLQNLTVVAKQQQQQQ